MPLHERYIIFTNQVRAEQGLGPREELVDETSNQIKQLQVFAHH